MSSHTYGSDRTAEAIAHLGWSALSDFEIAAINNDPKFYEAVRSRLEELKGRDWANRIMPLAHKPVITASTEERAAVEKFINERWFRIENLERLYGKNGSARIGQNKTEISLAQEYGYSYVKDPRGFWERQREQQSETTSAELANVNVVMKAVLVPGNKTREGQLIEAVALPWFAIIALLHRDPDAMFQIDWRRWEEIIAGAYVQEGFEVVLTPRSNDKGRDVIATRNGIGSIRIIDQVKAYRPGRVVTADEIRAMLGVLSLESNVSKGIVSTTSEFAPGIARDPQIASFTPYRLELKARAQLLDWLTSIAEKRNAK